MIKLLSCTFCNMIHWSGNEEGTTPFDHSLLTPCNKCGNEVFYVNETEEIIFAPDDFGTDGNNCFIPDEEVVFLDDDNFYHIITELMVLQSNAGYYVGRLMGDEPFSRESRYFETREEAQKLLVFMKTQDWSV